LVDPIVRVLNRKEPLPNLLLDRSLKNFRNVILWYPQQAYRHMFKDGLV
jgi:hypothetical protein